MTDVALKEHLEAKIASLREYVDSDSRGTQRALELATSALHDKFEEVNRFRDQLREERGVYARHDYVVGVEKRVTMLETSSAGMAGRWAGIALMAALFGSALGALISRWMGGH